PEIALRIIKALAMRLENANQHVELLLLPTPNHRVVQCLRHMAEEQLLLAGSPAGTAILVPKRVEDIAVRVGLPVHEVISVHDREPFGFERAGNFLALRADFVNDKDRRHRDLSTGRSPYTPNALQAAFSPLVSSRSVAGPREKAVGILRYQKGSQMSCLVQRE